MSDSNVRTDHSASGNSGRPLENSIIGVAEGKYARYFTMTGTL
jgi:hypothetical protein